MSALGSSRDSVWEVRAPNLASSQVFELAVHLLIDGYARRRGPMPMVVLHGKGPGVADDRVARIVGLLQESQKARRIPVLSLDSTRHPEGSGEYEAAVELIRSLGSKTAWRRGHGLQRRYRFPRSELIAAFDRAVEEVAEPHLATADSVVAKLRETWRQGPRSRRSGLLQRLGQRVNPASLVGAVALAALGGIAQGLAVLAVVVLAVLLSVLFLVDLVRLKWTPRRLAAGASWLASTTFLAASGDSAPVWSLWQPRRSRETVEKRFEEVAARLLEVQQTTGRAREAAQRFSLQLRVHALLEDLRTEHSRSWDARHRKRVTPPVAFLGQATEQNGGLALLTAVSDVRSRRSEMDPLLLITSVAQVDLSQLEATRDPAATTSGADERLPARLFARWARESLRTGQSPSLGATRPWILAVPLDQAQLTDREQSGSASEGPSDVLRTRPLPLNAWMLWSSWTLAAALVAAIAAGGLTVYSWSERYCGALGLTHDMVNQGGECVGVSADGASLPDPDKPVDMAGVSQDASGGPGSGVTLNRLETWIDRENGTVEKDPHITVVFAAALSYGTATPDQALDGLRQLAGAYMAQWQINNSRDHLKVRLLIANGGVGMHDQLEMAGRIRALAQRDASIVAVAGMGIDTEQSAEAVKVLQAAGLAVVDTTNSDDDLAGEFSNYFGLAATNKQEVAALRSYLQGHASAGRRILVLERHRDDGTHDTYSEQQATDALLAFDGNLASAQAKAFTAYPDGTDASMNDLVTEMCNDHVSAVYLAGRATDMQDLLTEIGQNSSCQGQRITVLTGDDVSRAQFGSLTSNQQSPVPPNVTVYWAGTTDLASADETLFTAQGGALGINVSPGTPAWSKLFQDSSAALAFDAVEVVQRAATAAHPPAGETPSASAVLGDLQQIEMPGATGTVDLRRRPVGPGLDDPVHGWEVFKVVEVNGKQASTPVWCQSAGAPSPRTCG